MGRRAGGGQGDGGSGRSNVRACTRQPNASPPPSPPLCTLTLNASPLPPPPLATLTLHRSGSHSRPAAMQGHCGGGGGEGGRMCGFGSQSGRACVAGGRSCLCCSRRSPRPPPHHHPIAHVARGAALALLLATLAVAPREAAQGRVGGGGAQRRRRGRGGLDPRALRAGERVQWTRHSRAAHSSPSPHRLEHLAPSQAQYFSQKLASPAGVGGGGSRVEQAGVSACRLAGCLAARSTRAPAQPQSRGLQTPTQLHGLY